MSKYLIKQKQFNRFAGDEFVGVLKANVPQSQLGWQKSLEFLAHVLRSEEGNHMQLVNIQSRSDSLFKAEDAYKNRMEEVHFLIIYF